MTAAFIQVDDVHKSFDGRPVLNGMSFTVEEGAIVGLLGPNGCGKTTMIRLLNGVIEQNSGSMSVAGMNPLADGDDIRRISGIVTEGAGLYHDMSAVDNLKFFSKLYQVKDKSRVRELLELFDLTEHANKPAGTFSTGMKKRLALAKALLHKPKLLFLDEPTNGLDPEGIRLVMKSLLELNERDGTTIFLCSHVLHQIETVCSTYIFMDKGRTIVTGTRSMIENRYMKSVELVVETGMLPAGDRYAGYPVRKEGLNRLRFSLPGKDAIPALLRQILADNWVHSAEIVNRDLESLYFEVRKEHA
ncbi:ABC transporter ATP-binding protein [Paenibacillus mendelii]|uniref:ATP-binding cassette domain-containing protein n=1 Tax=Paenibacillus mendelii TaxID=206163 RepID=A0ABV6J5P6_9BACL|nr:ABC transporter ATP-binding protein [Paenibacillus mendelii]MCQ6560087.1 ABC transporter ATP-binding protein [Paenibacillus mendelii]